MSYILKNKELEIHIDLPLEGYGFSRFDWTGKVSKVNFRNVAMSSTERTDEVDVNNFGKGFYNEFGIGTALGFDETPIGGWFHKIGVGLLKKEDDDYLFSRKYEVEPARFEVIKELERILIICESKTINGYSYILRKEIKLKDDSFEIHYHLQNTGDKVIRTSEYVHNFISIDKDLIGSDYILKFPFSLNQELFDQTVNPEEKVVIGRKQIEFNGSPLEQFFFSNMNGKEEVAAEWELINLRSKIGIRETASFRTNKVNLWGWSHVISPELFFDVIAEPGQSAEWSRTFSVYELSNALINIELSN